MSQLNSIQPHLSVALSVSTSASTSPGPTACPSLTCHVTRLPWLIVGDSAGMLSSCSGGRMERVWRGHTVQSTDAQPRRAALQAMSAAGSGGGGGGSQRRASAAQGQQPQPSMISPCEGEGR